MSIFRSAFACWRSDIASIVGFGGGTGVTTGGIILSTLVECNIGAGGASVLVDARFGFPNCDGIRPSMSVGGRTFSFPKLCMLPPTEKLFGIVGSLTAVSVVGNPCDEFGLPRPLRRCWGGDTGVGPVVFVLVTSPGTNGSGTGVVTGTAT